METGLFLHSPFCLQLGRTGNMYVLVVFLELRWASLEKHPAGARFILIARWKPLAASLGIAHEALDGALCLAKTGQAKNHSGACPQKNVPCLFLDPLRCHMPLFGGAYQQKGLSYFAARPNSDWGCGGLGDFKGSSVGMCQHRATPRAE